MKKSIFLILALTGICSAFWAFFSFGTGAGFQQYKQEWIYRRLHPEFLPSPILIKAFDMGHSSSYASFMWLSLIQYIADNMGGNEFLNFTNTILQNITSLHPYFIKPYEFGLILSPVSYGENMDPESRIRNIAYSRESIALGKTGMKILCNEEKLKKIYNRPITDNLLHDPTIKNPCASGLLPYYIAFLIQQVGENKIEASEYYKIASAQDDAPNASRMLGILALSSKGDHLSSALNFGLIAINGYDASPFVCRDLGKKIVQDISLKRPLTTNWISELATQEGSLKDTRDPKNPLSISSDNCYEMIQRSLREVYLEYITEVTKGKNVNTGAEILKQHIITKIPTLSNQKNYTVYLKDGVWEYRLAIQ